MSFTVLVIGDPHIRISHIPEAELFIERIEKLAKEKKPDLIVLLADTLDSHEKIHTTCLNKAYELIEKLSNISTFYTLVGNHDYTGNMAFLTSDHWMNALKKWPNVTVCDRVTTYTNKNIHLTFVPYVPPGRFEEALNTIGKEWEKTNCIFAHQEFRGCKMGAIISQLGDEWSLNYPHVVSGHIHSNQTPQKNVYYPGAAMQIAFGESKKNIIALLTFGETVPYQLQEIDLLLPRKRIEYIDVSDIDTFKEVESSDKIRLTVSGNIEEFKALKKTQKYKEIVKKGVKIVFKPKKIKNPYKNEKGESIVQDPEMIINETSFSKILNEIIHQQKDSSLYEAYEYVVNGKKIDSDDIVYI